MVAEEAEFDPYFKWLGIHPKDQPPNHYKLLGVELFESDPDVVSNAADARMLLVKTFQTGGNSDLSQRILNEVATAKVCLLSPEQKARYDLTLHMALGSASPGAAARVPGSSAPDWRIWGPVAGACGVLIVAVAAWLFGTGPDETAQLAESGRGAGYGTGQPSALAGASGPSDGVAGQIGGSSGEKGPGNGGGAATAKPLGGAAPVPPSGETALPQTDASAAGEPAMEMNGEVNFPSLMEENSSAGADDSAGRAGEATASSATGVKTAAAAKPLPSLSEKLPISSAGTSSSPTASVPEPGRAMPPLDDDGTLDGAAKSTNPPVPSRNDRQRVEKEIRALFRSELASAKSSQDALALSDQLSQQALERDDDLAAQYVLLEMACNLAAKVGDLPRAQRVIDEIATRFDVDAMERKADMLNDAVEATRSLPPQSITNLDMLENGLLLADHALATGKPDVASRLLKSANAIARRTKINELVQEVKSRAKTVSQVQRDLDKVNQALKTLKLNPADDEANFTVGTWYCLVRKEWRRGLPYLARCEDLVLSALAQRDIDLTDSTDPEAHFALATTWWEEGRKKEGDLQLGMYDRAVEWFNRAMPALSADQATGAQEDLDEVLKAIERLRPNKQGTVQEGNVALESNDARASGGANARGLIDGIFQPLGGAGGIASAAWPCEWTITLNDVYRLREIRMSFPPGANSYQNYVLSTSADGREFVPVVDRRKGRFFGWQQIVFLPRPVRAIKIYGFYHSGDSNFYVAELEAYCVRPAAPPR